MRKKFGPFLARRFAWRRVSHCSSDRHSSPDFTSNSSFSGSSLDSSSDISSGLSSDSYLDSSSVHSSGCDASGQYHSGPSTRVAPPRLVDPLMSLDSSSPFARPSRKRCRSPATLVPSSTHVSRSIAPALIDLPPCKRFRDLYSYEASGEEHMEIGMGVKVATSGIREDEEEFKAEDSVRGTIEIAVDPLVTGGISEPTGGDAPDLEGTLYDISHYMYEVPLDRITERENLRIRALLCIERDRVNSLHRHMALSSEEFHQVRRDRDDTRRRLRRTMTNTRSKMTPAVIEEMINRRVTEALETREANRNIGLGNDNDEDGNENGNGNGNGRGNGNRNHNENDRDARPVVRECTYQDFMKCQPLNFKGTKGVVGLIRWFEKMETIFHISNCPEKYQVKELMKLMAEVYYPRTEIQKMESKWFPIPKEEDRLEKFIGGLPDNIQGNVIAAEPTRLQDAVRMANNLMDQKLKARASTGGNNERIVYNGPLPLYNKCKFHHEGPCTVRCGKCNKVRHLTKDYKATIFTTSNQRGQVVNQRVLTCFECGNQGHYMSDCPKLKDQNRGNKTGNKSGIGEARGKAYVLGEGDANPDSNVITGTFLLNNHYASVLFGLGADRSFVSTTFSTLLDIISNTLDVSYAVELADRRVSETNTVLRGCTLGLLGYPFNIDLMLVELSSFDVIIGMDYLANHHVVIVCDDFHNFITSVGRV
ncbi:putative reverse transcriptase domain-containing protein [Tanacetum coccineum]